MADEKGKSSMARGWKVYFYCLLSLVVLLLDNFMVNLEPPRHIFTVEISCKILKPSSQVVNI